MPSPHNGANQKTDGFRVVRGALPASIVVASLACSSAAFAEDRSYGRFDGDLALAGELALVASEDGPALGVRATASYLTMAGAYAEYDSTARENRWRGGSRAASSCGRSSSRDS